LAGHKRGTLESVRIRSDPPDQELPGHSVWAGGLPGSRREVPVVPDNIVLIIRFHPVGGEDVFVVSEDPDLEDAATAVIACSSRSFR